MRCVASLESTYGDTPAMRRVVNDAHRIRNGIHRLQIDAEDLPPGAAAVPDTRSAEMTQIPDTEYDAELLAGRRPRRNWLPEPGVRATVAKAPLIDSGSAQQRSRCQRHRFEIACLAVDEVEQPSLHPRVPELPDVLGDLGHRLVGG